MGILISVYTKEAFKEYIMPAIDNADYSISINKTYFSLQNDMRLDFEVIKGVWKIKPNQDYHIYLAQCEIKEKTKLCDNSFFQIETFNKKKILLMVRDVQEVFSSYRKFDVSRMGRITIGSGENNLIRYDIRYDNQHIVSKEHAEIIRKGRDLVISCNGHNGLHINSKYVTGTQTLHFGDFINIYGLHMVFLKEILAIDINNPMVEVKEKSLLPFVEVEEEHIQKENCELPPIKKMFHRSPRIIEKIEQEPLEIEEPPKEIKSQKRPLLMTIGPSFTMALPMLLGALLMIVSSKASGNSSGLFMYSGLIMSVSSASIGVLWGVLNIRYQKKTEIENENHRYEAYSDYLIKKTEAIKEKYIHNQTALNKMYPKAETCLSYNEDSVMLWNRNFSHEDFLCCRIGEGETNFQVDIQVPKEKFKLDRDELAERPEFIKNNYRTLTKVPILIDLLKYRLIGIVGGAEKKGAFDVSRIIATQIAVCNCYTDVKMIFIYDKDHSENQGEWDFAKWFPHVWAEDKKIRYIASNKLEASEVFYELTKIFRQRLENVSSVSSEKRFIPKPYFIMFLSDPSLIEEELIAKYVFDSSPEIGLSTIMLSENSEMLPNACEFIVENDSDFRGIYNVSSQKEERTKVNFDSVEKKQLEKFSRWMSNLEVQEIETGGEIPNTLTFFDMYNISKPADLKVTERWLKNRNYDNIRGLIGQKSGGVPCYLDVHEKYHGPHGLVAGTTGSGKSETLQTYMLSLAINYSPDDVGFFIIDYKGGGMANLFDGLPHLIGQISNLSGNQVYRAMVSIKSENRRRQKIFNEHGVNNINNYTKMYKNKEASVPIPHLFIIIDEFAELKREEPEFMKELVSVAQVGRSLGVHLILATQKPSGTVDDNIWSNSKFKLCLRVQDRQDSNDMLHKPDAAYITQAGRCYLQVGNDEVYELFQSGWSGAPYDENIEENNVEIAKMLSIDGKAEMTGAHAQNMRKEQVLLLWIEKLVKCLEKTSIQDKSRLSDLLQEKIDWQDVVNEFYTVLEHNQVEYQRNEYNSIRLKNFISVYAMASNLKGNLAENIIKISVEKNVQLPKVQEKTQLDAIKDYLQKTAIENGYRQVHRLWMPVLPGHIYLEDFEEFNRWSFKNGQWNEQRSWTFGIPIGMVDDPKNQSQMPLQFSFSKGGHHAIIGSVVSGKSTMMQTILYGLVSKYTPDYINVYALDFSSKMMHAFQGLAHFGGIMYEGDDEKISKFFNMMEHILDERKRIFKGGNYSQYVQVHGVKHPAIVIAIDNFSAFNEKTENKYEKVIVQLSKEGVGHGIYLLLSSSGFGMNEIPTRIAENIKTVLCLELPDKFAYADVLHEVHLEVLPEKGIKGRGLAYFGEHILEYQTALALKADDDYQRMEKISVMCTKMNQSWKGKKARQIPEIPSNPTWELFSELYDVQQAVHEPYFLPVGYNYENAEIYSIDLRKFYCYLITGLSKCGKKNYLKVMIESARLKQSKICLIDGVGVLKKYANQSDIHYISNEEEMFAYFKEDFALEFLKRNAIKKQLLENDGDEEDLYLYTQKETPIFVFITNMKWFMNVLYSPQNIQSGLKEYMETILLKGRYHNIFFIGILNLDDKSVLSGYQSFLNFISYKEGIHFGGNVSKNNLMNFSYMGFKEQTKTERAGVGLLPEINDESEVKKIIVPLMKTKHIPVLLSEVPGGDKI